jgi:small subunit ribosomal protein S14
MSRKGLIERWKKTKRFKVREYHRCEKCGRAKGYIRAFKICRICFRELAHQGVLPGVTKSSW